MPALKGDDLVIPGPHDVRPAESLRLLDPQGGGGVHGGRGPPAELQARLEHVVGPVAGVPVGPRHGGTGPQGGEKGLAELVAGSIERIKSLVDQESVPISLVVVIAISLKHSLFIRSVKIFSTSCAVLTHQVLH